MPTQPNGKNGFSFLHTYVHKKQINPPFDLEVSIMMVNERMHTYIEHIQYILFALAIFQSFSCISIHLSIVLYLPSSLHSQLLFFLSHCYFLFCLLLPLTINLPIYIYIFIQPCLGDKYKFSMDYVVQRKRKSVKFCLRIDKCVCSVHLPTHTKAITNESFVLYLLNR